MSARIAALVVLAAALLSRPALAAEHLHPPVELRDADGFIVMPEDATAATEESCTGCHDTDYILGHDSHRARGVEIDCLQCHLPGRVKSLEPEDFDDSGRLTRPMEPPECGACGQCHGQVHHDAAFMEIDPTIRRGEIPGPFGTSLMTGEIFSPQTLSASFLNLADKPDLVRPWDVHAERGVHCRSCHFPANDPARADLIPRPGQRHLIRDPRSQKLNDYLRKPDHRLATASCTSCHDPGPAHANFSYPKRHLEALSCQACHVPTLRGPALQWQDRTVLTADDGPRMKLRGVDAGEGAVPNAWFYEGYQPLLGHELVDGRSKLSPYNAVTTWQWVSSQDGSPVTPELLRQAWKDEKGHYAPEVVAALDADGDGTLATAELILDDESKIAVIRTRLERLGVQAPRIEGIIELHPVRHGVVSGKWVEHDCMSCHAAESRLNVPVDLASGPFPGGVVPVLHPQAASQLGGRVVTRSGNDLRLVGNQEPPGHYILGHSRRPWSDRLGFWMFLLTALGVTAHGSGRILASRRREQHAAAATARIYMYSAAERLWHWTMAASVLVLLLSGLAIHYPQTFALLDLRSAVFAHNLFAAVLLITAFLSMLVHVATGEVRQLIPKGAGLPLRLRLQVQFYLKGIFVGASHPFTKNREQKLNPLQQLTYAGLLNALLPFQVVTGILLWVAGYAPEAVRPIGGLSVIAPLHNLGSWMFLTFVVVHVYLTTTGHTVTSNIKAMVTGWDLEDVAPEQTATAEGVKP